MATGVACLFLIKVALVRLPRVAPVRHAASRFPPPTRGASFSRRPEDCLLQEQA